MGLKEKQAIAGLDFGYYEKSIKENTGTDVIIDIDVASFANDLDAILYAESRGAHLLSNAISRICTDDIGKQAFKDKKISRIILKNQAPGNRSIKFEGGHLLMAFAFASREDYYSEGEVLREIENAL